jgi:anaerobic C4-dicarboxylate transporter
MDWRLIVAPANIPGEVLLIVLTVIMAASAMEVAGGIDFLVRVAERIIRLRRLRRTPKPWFAIPTAPIAT